MSRAPRAFTIRLRGVGCWGALAVVAIAACALIVLPRLLSPPLTPADALASIRNHESGIIRDEFLPRLRTSGVDSATVLTEMARAMAEVSRTQRTVEGIRRSWFGPPFTRNWAFAIRVRESPSDEVAYYRVRRTLAFPASAWYWRMPVL